MALIYFFGSPMNGDFNVDGVPVAPGENDATSVIRGYDEAGNLLVHIREYPKLLPVIFPVNERGTFRYVNRVLTQLDGDPQGHIYTVWRFYFGDYRIWNDYVDQFRVYRRNGDRVPWPHPCGVFFASAVAVDKTDRSVYVGAFIGYSMSYLSTVPPTGYENRQCLFKYQPDGTLVWSKALSPGYVNTTIPGFPGQQTQDNTYDAIEKIFVDDSGDVFVIAVIYTGGALIKYDGATGAVLWSTGFFGGPIDLCFDGSGNIYVAAGAGCYGYELDYLSNVEAFYFDPQWVFFSAEIPYRGYQIIKLNSSGVPIAFVQGPEVPFIEELQELENRTSPQWAIDKIEYYDGNLIGTRDDQADGLLYIFNTNLEFIESRATRPVFTTPLTNWPAENFYYKSNKDFANFAINPANGRMYFPGGRISKPLTDEDGDLHNFQSGGTYNYDGVIWGSYHFLVLDQAGNWLWKNKNATAEAGVDRYGRPWSTYDNYVSTLGLTPSQIHGQYNNIPDYVGIAYFGLTSALGVDFWYNKPSQDGLAFISGAVIVPDTETPALMVPLPLALPTMLGDRFTRAPALALGVLPALPRVIRDYLGDVVSIFRLFMTGAALPLELSLRSLQVRRNPSVERATLIVPWGAPELLLDIEARRAAGAELVVFMGVRLPGGGEQIDEVIRVPLLAARFDRGPREGSLTLSGERAAPISNNVRTARALSYRNTNGGRRQVRGAVDFWLLPGDTLLLGGGESMTVGEITLSVTPTAGQMDVSELLT